MCNLYSHISNIEAIRCLVGDFNRLYEDVENRHHSLAYILTTPHPL